jgi:hypothetical protein
LGHSEDVKYCNVRQGYGMLRRKSHKPCFNKMAHHIWARVQKPMTACSPFTLRDRGGTNIIKGSMISLTKIRVLLHGKRE